MAIYPGAKQRLIPKWNRVAMTRYRRMNLHVAVMNGPSAYSWFAGTDSACAHFYVAKDGSVEQYIDTKYRSASDLHGNDSTISVETAGGVTKPNAEPWTAAQVLALAKLWAWARDTHGITDKLATNTQTNENSAGLSWHRLGVQGNFAGRPGVLSVSYKPGGILYSKAAGKECPGDAKILQIPGIWKTAHGKSYKEIGGTSAPAKPVASKPATSTPAKKPAASKPSGKGWPAQPLPITDKHTAASDAAWRELMAAIGYKDKDLGKNLQSWLSKLTDPRTGKGYYPMPPLQHDGVMGEYGVKALQRKLYDTKDASGHRLYTGKADGKRGPMTIHAEIAYLNLPANRGL